MNGIFYIMIMTEKEFTEEVRKKLLKGIFPGEHGRKEHLSADYVETLLQKPGWDFTRACTAIHKEFLRENEYKTQEAWVEATVNYLWTNDNC